MIMKKLRALATTIAKAKYTFTPSLRLVEIMKTVEDEFVVTIQIINKDIIYNAKPEEILVNDHLVDQFSPRDIRTLTYLGYLGINGPKYKILAQRLSEDNDKIIFALKKKGQKNIIVNTADEILNKKEIMTGLQASDAQIIGYTAASESIFSEKRMKDVAAQQDGKGI